MTFAHVAGIPLEELLALAPAAGAIWIALQARAHGRGSQSGRPR